MEEYYESPGVKDEAKQQAVGARVISDYAHKLHADAKAVDSFGERAL